MTIRIAPIKCPDCGRSTDLMIKGRTYIDIAATAPTTLRFLESCMHCGRYYSAVLDLTVKVEVLSFANQTGELSYDD